MNLKKTVSTTLLAFVVLSIGYTIGKEHGRRTAVMPHSDKSREGAANSSDQSDSKINDNESHRVVYFFHRKERCATCRKIEAYTHEAVVKNYGDALRDGRIEWRVHCFETPENARFKNRFGLFTSTVVLAEVRGEEIVRFRDLVENVWEKVKGDRDAFSKYISEEISIFLAPPSAAPEVTP